MPVLYRAVALGGAAVDRDAVPGVEVSQPHDLEEQEADRVAEVVMRSAEPDQAEQPPVRPADARGGGQALDPADRAYFERQFGADFGAVRVHSDAAAERNARMLSANAFTIGSDISFASGRYAPGTVAGRTLLAHELTHVVQQARGGGQRVHRQGSGLPDLGKGDQTTRHRHQGHSRVHEASTRTTGGEPTTSSPRSRRGSCRPSRFYLCRKLKQLFDTPVSSRAAITAQTQTSTSTAAAQERTRLATPSAQADIDIEEKAAADPKRARGWVPIKGRFGGGTYFVNRTSPTDIVVRAEIMLIPTGRGTTNDVKAIKGMEDAIEKATSTKGYRVDLKFVDVAGPYTFKVNVDPSRWEVATNWSGGDPRGFAHELHHLFAFELDRYNYIESHATNQVNGSRTAAGVVRKRAEQTGGVQRSDLDHGFGAAPQRIRCVHRRGTRREDLCRGPGRQITLRRRGPGANPINGPVTPQEHLEWCGAA